MKPYEKIKNIRKGQNLSVNDVYNRAVALWGRGKAISPRTINRIEAGQPHTFSSLSKYCTILGIALSELFKDTELEDRVLIKKNERPGGYIDKGRVCSGIVNNPNQGFLMQEFILEPSQETTVDQAPVEKGKFQKCLYVVKGELLAYIEKEEFLLKARDSLSLDSTKAHYFKNNSRKKCIFVVVENPARY